MIGCSRKMGWPAAIGMAALLGLGLGIAAVPGPASAQSSAEITATMQQLERDAKSAGHLNRVLTDTIGKVQVSIGKCLAEIKRVGDNDEVRKILNNITRKPGQQYFNLSTENVLARLEKAAGRKLNLTAFDLETCVQSFDLYAGLQAHTNPVLTTPGQSCPAGTNFCEGTEVGFICCGGSFPICAQSCDEDGDCEPYCEPSLSCFPSDATVTMADGSARRMDELRIGDRVAVVRPDGTRGFDDVYLFTHKDGVRANAYRILTLASGRQLALSPRHFIPVASDGSASWGARVVKAADEVGIGDVVWYDAADGGTASSTVTAVATEARPGLFNPLTMGGTIVVDGVVASAHSDWFLDKIASPATQDAVYQALFLPVRAAYRVIGPEWTETVAERWGVVDAVRDASLPSAFGWLVAFAGAGLALVWWRRRAVAG